MMNRFTINEPDIEALHERMFEPNHQNESEFSTVWNESIHYNEPNTESNTLLEIQQLCMSKTPLNTKHFECCIMRSLISLL